MPGLVALFQHLDSSSNFDVMTVSMSLTHPQLAIPPRSLHDFFSKKNLIQKKKEASSTEAATSEAATTSPEEPPEDVDNASNVNCASNVPLASSSSSSPFPDIWTEEMWRRKQDAYPWIDCKAGKLGCKVCTSISDLSVFKTQGSRLADEWRSYTVTYSGKDKSGMLTSLRKKIIKHKESNGHTTAQRIQENAKKETLEKVCDNMNASKLKATCAVFRSAYYLAQNDRPFLDNYGLLELQHENGVDIGIGLHSRYSASQIVDHISSEMRKKACQRIQAIEGKVSILIDESTSGMQNDLDCLPQM